MRHVIRNIGIPSYYLFALCALITTIPFRASASITIFPRVGSSSDSTVTPQGPGLILMGGGDDVDAAFVWMHDTIVGSTAAGGDVVVLRATGTNAYDDYIDGLADFNSVQTLIISASASAGDLSTAAGIVDKAEGVFFAGGDQADYVGWKGTSLMTAVANVYGRGGVVGGASAGLAILGEFVFDSVAADEDDYADVLSEDATADPFEQIISFTYNLLSFPPMAGAITDSHFQNRDRFGRLAAFMARQIEDGKVDTTPARILGIGVDEGNAIVVDHNGIGKLLQYDSGTGAAYLLQGGTPTTINDGDALLYEDITVTRLDSPGQEFNFNLWCGTGATYLVTVAGTGSIYDPTNPYTATGPAGICSTEISDGDLVNDVVSESSPEPADVVEPMPDMHFADESSWLQDVVESKEDIKVQEVYGDADSGTSACNCDHSCPTQSNSGGGSCNASATGPFAGSVFFLLLGLQLVFKRLRRGDDAI